MIVITLPYSILFLLVWATLPVGLFNLGTPLATEMDIKRKERGHH